MITITKTISSCLSNRIVPCTVTCSTFCSAESYLKTQLNTYIIRIQQQKRYSYRQLVAAAMGGAIGGGGRGPWPLQ